MELAAIASAAVPGLAPTGVAGVPDDAADFDSALLIDGAGKQWRVRSPKHAEASMRLETELQALRAFSHAVKAELPFLVPHMAGSVRQGELSTFVYSHLAGTTRPLDALAAGGRTLAQEIGRVIAAIHELPKDMVQRADLPSYEADEYRQRKLNELDQAATTGKIPSILLRRWEHALEDVALWRFSPTVVHGNLHEDHILISAGRVSAVTGWTDLCIGDPAEDFAWLAAAEDAAFVDAVYSTYVEARVNAVDPHLYRRAALAAEFALAQWLVRGVALEDPGMVHEAEDMLATLAADVESIEREQHEAAERARRIHEERLEWGNELGTDADDYHHPAVPQDEPSGAHAVSGDGPTGVTAGGDGSGNGPDHEADGGPVTGVAATTDEVVLTAPDGGSDSGSTGRSKGGSDGRGDGGGDAGGSGRTGSHAYDPEAPTGDHGPRRPSDQSGHPGNHPDGPGRHGDDDHGTPSGSSLAYARLTAGRQRPAGTPSKVPLTRNSESGADSSDDVATTALPIVSFGH